MTIQYIVIVNDHVTNKVVVRFQDGDWQQGANFRDEVFDLNFVSPGAVERFAVMGLPFDYTAALDYLERQLSVLLSRGDIQVTPPGWTAEVNGLFAQPCDNTPKEYIPVPPVVDAEPDAQGELPLGFPA